MNKYKIYKKNFKQMIGNFFIIGGLISIGTSGVLIHKLNNRNSDAVKNATVIEQAVNQEYINNQIFYENEEKKSEKSVEKADYSKEYINKYDFDKLREINPDIVGILEGDCFSEGYYPVVSSEDYDDLNKKLNLSLDGSYSRAGMIIADPQNDENMQGIYRIWGHHFAGEEDNGLMFSSLVNYDSEEYYENHKTLKYYTENGEYELQVYACTKDNPFDEYIGYQNEDILQKEIDDIKNMSLINTNVEIDPSDRQVVLTTCTRLGSKNEPDLRISVHTKVIPVWEKTIQNNKTK